MLLGDLQLLFLAACRKELYRISLADELIAKGFGEAETGLWPKRGQLRKTMRHARLLGISIDIIC